MKETLTLNREEQRRVLVLNEVVAGGLTAGKAAEVLGLSVRHLRRILAAYREEGAAAIAHGNRGRAAKNALGEEERRRILDFARTKYAGFNHLHMGEKLTREEGIGAGLSTVRRILAGAGLASPRKRRPAKHRSRRERYPKEGMLLQIDGSPHDWLEGRGALMCLVGGIDDATGTVPYALFRTAEDSAGYILLLQGVAARQGVPLAVYRDRHSIFETSSREPTLAEQLKGRREPTQFGRVLEELGVASIPARSPQAKGRIERLWGTFQDRLVSEMRLAAISDLDAANAFLPGFLDRFNGQFAVPAVQAGSAYRPMPKGLDPKTVFCFKESRVVAMDNTVTYGPTVLQLLPCPERASYARATVSVHEHLDGSLAVYLDGQELRIRPAPAEPARLRAVAPGPRAGTKQAEKAAKKVGNPAWAGTSSSARHSGHPDDATLARKRSCPYPHQMSGQTEAGNAGERPAEG